MLNVAAALSALTSAFVIGRNRCIRIDPNEKSRDRSAQYVTRERLN